MTFYTSLGAAYVMRVDGVPATTGYGEPLQSHFSFSDGDRVVGVISNDARHRKHLQETLLDGGDGPPPPHGFAISQRGRVLRFALKAHEDISTKNGRRYARLAKGDAIFLAAAIEGAENVAVASTGGRAMLFPLSETPVLKAAGRGVTGIKLREDDELVACQLVRGSLAGPAVQTSFGRDLVIRERKFGIGKRGGRGKVVLKRGTIDLWHRNPTVQTGSDKDAPPPIVDDEEDLD